MRKIACFDLHGVDVQDVLEEFNERCEEFNITKETDIISLSVREAAHPHKIAQPGGLTKDSTVVVSIFYWSE
jgi:hypothetical protein